MTIIERIEELKARYKNSSQFNVKANSVEVAALLFGEAADVLAECEAVIERVVFWMDANGYSPLDQSFGARAALSKLRGTTTKGT